MMDNLDDAERKAAATDSNDKNDNESNNNKSLSTPSEFDAKDDGEQVSTTIANVTSETIVQSSPYSAVKNEFTGYYAGHIRIECITPQLLQWNDAPDVFVSSQLGRMFPNLDITEDLFGKFVTSIDRMKKDFKGYVKNEYEKETTTFAQLLGMKNPQAGNKKIMLWSEFGNEFIHTPGYVEAARWWMCLYAARDRDSEKEARYEAEWMKNCHLRYVSIDDDDKTGLRKIARARMNNIIKTSNTKLKEAIGFGISKSCKMIVDDKTQKRKQGERRVKSVFRKEFVQAWASFKNRKEEIDFPAYLAKRKEEGLQVGEDFCGHTLPVDWFYNSIIQQTFNNSEVIGSTKTVSIEEFLLHLILCLKSIIDIAFF